MFRSVKITSANPSAPRRMLSSKKNAFTPFTPSPLDSASGCDVSLVISSPTFSTGPSSAGAPPRASGWDECTGVESLTRSQRQCTTAKSKPSLRVSSKPNPLVPRLGKSKKKKVYKTKHLDSFVGYRELPSRSKNRQTKSPSQFSGWGNFRFPTSVPDHVEPLFYQQCPSTMFNKKQNKKHHSGPLFVNEGESEDEEIQMAFRETSYQFKTQYDSNEIACEYFSFLSGVGELVDNARYLLASIKRDIGKLPNKYLTWQEVCDHLRLRGVSSRVWGSKISVLYAIPWVLGHPVHLPPDVKRLVCRRDSNASIPYLIFKYMELMYPGREYWIPLKYTKTTLARNDENIWKPILKREFGAQWKTFYKPTIPCKVNLHTCTFAHTCDSVQIGQTERSVLYLKAKAKGWEYEWSHPCTTVTQLKKFLNIEVVAVKKETRSALFKRAKSLGYRGKWKESPLVKLKEFLANIPQSESTAHLPDEYSQIIQTSKGARLRSRLFKFAQTLGWTRKWNESYSEPLKAFIEDAHRPMPEPVPEPFVPAVRTYGSRDPLFRPMEDVPYPAALDDVPRYVDAGEEMPRGDYLNVYKFIPPLKMADVMQAEIHKANYYLSVMRLSSRMGKRPSEIDAAWNRGSIKEVASKFVKLALSHFRSGLLGGSFGVDIHNGMITNRPTAQDMSIWLRNVFSHEQFRIRKGDLRVERFRLTRAYRHEAISVSMQSLASLLRVYLGLQWRLQANRLWSGRSAQFVFRTPDGVRSWSFVYQFGGGDSFIQQFQTWFDNLPDEYDSLEGSLQAIQVVERRAVRGGHDVDEEVVRSIGALKVVDVPSTDNNCGIECLLRYLRVNPQRRGKKYDPKRIRQQLDFEENAPLTPQQVCCVGDHFGVPTAVYAQKQSALRCVARSHVCGDKTCYVYLNRALGHYCLLKEQAEKVECHVCGCMVKDIISHRCSRNVISFNHFHHPDPEDEEFVKPYRAEDVEYVPVVFDLETFPHPETGVHQAYACGYLYEGVYHMDEGQDCLKGLIDLSEKFTAEEKAARAQVPKRKGRRRKSDQRRDRVMVFIAHNGCRFDFMFLLRALKQRGEELKLLMDSGRLLQMEWGCCKVWDSCLFMMASLKKLAKSFRCKVQKGDFDHTLMTDWDDVEKFRDGESGWAPYLQADVLSLSEIVQKYEAAVREIDEGARVFGSITQSQMAYNLFRLTLKDEESNALVVKLPVPQGAQYEMVRNAVFGGRVQPLEKSFTSEVFDEIPAELLEKIEKTDVPVQDPRLAELHEKAWQSGDYLFNADKNSLYPTAMMKEFPVGRLLETKTEGEKWFKAGKLGVYRVELTPPENWADLVMAPVPLRMQPMHDGTKKATKDYRASGVFWGFRAGDEADLTNPDIEIALSHGYGVKFVGPALFCNSKAAVFKDYIEKVYTIKETQSKLKAKEEAGEETSDKYNPALRQAAKLLMNALYGKMIQRKQGNGVRFVASAADWEEVEQDYAIDSFAIIEDELLVRYTDPNAANTKPSMLGAFILGYSRQLMMETYDVASERLTKRTFTYTDTDSIHLKGAAHQKLMREHPEIFHNSELGKLSNDVDAWDAIIVREVCVGPKSYAYIWLSRDGKLGMVKKCKGIPHSALFNHVSLADYEGQITRVVPMPNRLKRELMHKEIPFTVRNVDMHRTFFKTPWTEREHPRAVLVGNAYLPIRQEISTRVVRVHWARVDGEVLQLFKRFFSDDDIRRWKIRMNEDLGVALFSPTPEGVRKVIAFREAYYGMLSDEDLRENELDRPPSPEEVGEPVQLPYAAKGPVREATWFGKQKPSRYFHRKQGGWREVKWGNYRFSFMSDEMLARCLQSARDHKTACELYEVLDQNVTLFCDVDGKTDHPGVDPKRFELLDDVIAAMRKVAHDCWEVDLHPSGFRVLDGSRPGKLSFHISHVDHVFEHNSCQESFWNSVHKELKAKYGDDGPLDLRVYHRNRAMRTIYGCKPGKEQYPLRPIGKRAGKWEDVADPVIREYLLMRKEGSFDLYSPMSVDSVKSKRRRGHKKYGKKLLDRLSDVTIHYKLQEWFGTEDGKKVLEGFDLRYFRSPQVDADGLMVSCILERVSTSMCQFCDKAHESDNMGITLGNGYVSVRCFRAGSTKRFKL